MKIQGLHHNAYRCQDAEQTPAVDGGISVDGCLGGRIGDSIVVTETGCDYLTRYPRDILIVER